MWYLSEVLCADARPADLTVTVILRVNGERVAQANVGLFAQHKLRSGNAVRCACSCRPCRA